MSKINSPDNSRQKRRRSRGKVSSAYAQMTLLSPDADIFHKAAFLTLDATTGLRAGNALHLTSALQANVKRMATLDDVFARNAKQRKIAVVVL